MPEFIQSLSYSNHRSCISISILHLCSACYTRSRTYPLCQYLHHWPITTRVEWKWPKIFFLEFQLARYVKRCQHIIRTLCTKTKISGQFFDLPSQLFTAQVHTCQMPSRSSQPSLHGSRCMVPILYCRLAPSAPPKLLLPRGDLSRHLIRGYLGPLESTAQTTHQSVQSICRVHQCLQQSPTDTDSQRQNTPKQV